MLDELKDRQGMGVAWDAAEVVVWSNFAVVKDPSDKDFGINLMECPGKL